MTTELATTELTSTQAAKLLERIKSAVDKVCLLLVEMHDGKGWKALGYGSWQNFCEVEFKSYSIRYVNNLVNQGRVAKQLGTIVPESHARELRGVDQEQQAEVYEEAKRRFGDDLTAANVATVVDEWREEDAEPSPIDSFVLPEPEVEDEGDEEEPERQPEPSLIGELKRQLGVCCDRFQTAAVQAIVADWFADRRQKEQQAA